MPSLSSQTALGSKSKGGVLSDSALTSAADKMRQMQKDLDIKYTGMVDYYSDLMKNTPWPSNSQQATTKITAGSTTAGILNGLGTVGYDWGMTGTSMYYQEICMYCNGVYQISQSQYNSTGKRGASHYCKIQLREEERAREKKLEHDMYIRGYYGSPEHDVKKTVDPITKGHVEREKKEAQHEKNLRKVYWNYRSRNPHAA